jgi:AcrR family transcriptional regulator
VSGRGSARRALGEQTRSKIVDTALSLFARHGVDAVSVNEICTACGVNPAAVHYHFGSKDRLISEILQRWIDLVSDRRLELIAALEALDEPTVEQVVEAVVLPTLEFTRAEDVLPYVPFYASVINSPNFAHLAVERADVFTDRYVGLLERALPGIPRDVLLRRLTVCRASLYHTLAAASGPMSAWFHSHGVIDTDAMRDDFVPFFAGALSAQPARSRSAKKPRPRRAASAR